MASLTCSFGSRGLELSMFLGGLSVDVENVAVEGRHEDQRRICDQSFSTPKKRAATSLAYPMRYLTTCL